MTSSLSSPQILQIAMLVLCLWFVEGVIVNYAGLFDICWMAAPDETSFMSTFLFWVAIVALGAFVLLAALRALGDGAWRVQRPVAFAAAFWFAWWFGTFMVIQAVSAGLGDTTCHRRQRHNAVSGHFGFFIFWNLSALWLLRLVVGEPSTANYLGPALWWRAFKRPGAAHVLAITVAVLCTCSTLTLLRTWFLGYHSMRQCVLGSFVAVTSHYLCANSLDHLFFAPSEERWQWASVWSLRTVLAHALFAAVFEWLVTRRSSLGLGEASMMVLSVNHAVEILPGFVASALGMIVMGWAPDLIHRATNGGRVKAVRRDTWDRRMEDREERTRQLIKQAHAADKLV